MGVQPTTSPPPPRIATEISTSPASPPRLIFPWSNHYRDVDWMPATMPLLASSIQLVSYLSIPPTWGVVSRISGANRDHLHSSGPAEARVYDAACAEEKLKMQALVGLWLRADFQRASIVTIHLIVPAPYLRIGGVVPGAR